jgi:hypothetical protein
VRSRPSHWCDCSSVLSDPAPSVLRTAEGAVGEVEKAVLIDCDDCAVRDLQCGDCVMTVLLGAGSFHEVDAGEVRALDVLAASGLVPRLRLVPLGTPRLRPDAEAS